MKKATLEKNIVILLFILVMIVFSLAEKDSKKMVRQPAVITSVDSLKGIDNTAANMQPSANNQN
jgi:hypothetical protein